MTKEELFKKYGVNESHGIWTKTDSFMFVELYRIMHDGKLPPETDTGLQYVLDFLDKVKTDMRFVSKLRSRVPDDFGSLFLTARRIVFTHVECILRDINNKTK